MKRTLSVVLPVRNAELTLADNLQNVFDVLADLTERFEVLLVDEGSTDQTAEVAHELSVLYPQLRVTRRTDQWNVAGGGDRELDETSGEVVLLHESQARFSPCVLRKLWELPDEETTAAESSQRPASHERSGVPARVDGNSTPRPLGMRTEQVTEMSGVRMIRRAGKSAVR